MHGVRDPLKQHPRLSALLLVLALLFKVFVPSGYMLDGSARTFGFVPCSGMAQTYAKPMATAMPRMAHHAGHHNKKDGQSSEQPCAFAGLNAVSLAAADAVLLALALAFVMAAVFRRVSPKAARPRAYLRPPLRGPPLLQ